jgi:hypothetical protein
MTHYNRITLDLINTMMEHNVESGEFTMALWDWHKLNYDNPKAFKDNLRVLRTHLKGMTDD